MYKLFQNVSVNGKNIDRVDHKWVVFCSDAGRGVEVGSTGPGGRLSSVSQGASHVCGAAVGAALPAGLQDQYRPCCTASL